jgi:hypothetical protein
MGVGNSKLRGPALPQLRVFHGLVDLKLVGDIRTYPAAALVSMSSAYPAAALVSMSSAYPMTHVV